MIRRGCGGLCRRINRALPLQPNGAELFSG